MSDVVRMRTRLARLLPLVVSLALAAGGAVALAPAATAGAAETAGATDTASDTATDNAGATTGAAASAAAGPSVELLGHGFGHGRGLGQYGSLGYALDQGWTSERILDHFYGRTTAGTQPARDISVRLTALDGASTVTLTSAAGFYVGDVLVGGGSGAVLTRSGQQWTLRTQYAGCRGDGTTYGPWTFPAGVVVRPVAAPASASQLLTSCATGVGYRGRLAMSLDGSTTRVVNVLPLEEYLRGVVPRESPAAWADLGGGRGIEALEAQSVAARSYASAENRYPYANTCDTISCQVYGGAAKDGAWTEDSRTDRAIAATAGVVRRWPDGRVVRTEFSSSTGGWTAGGDFPAVPDAGDTRSPNHTWRTTLTGAAIQAAYPQIGTFAALRVTSRNGLGDEGGRVLTMSVTGSSGSVSVTGNAFRSAMGLRSDWFTPITPPQLRWLTRNTASTGPTEQSFAYGVPSDAVLSCDVDGNGADDVVAYRSGTWFIRTGTGPEVQFAYGDASMRPVCGDWDGDGRDGVGVFDAGGTWWLRNSAGPGAPDLRFAYGWGAAQPVVGDVGGTGRDGVGVLDPASARWYLRATASAGPAEAVFAYGWAGVRGVLADWDGDGRDTIGIYAGGEWLLRDSNTPGAPDRRFLYGTGDDRPVTGDWDGVGADGVGVARPE